MSGSVGISKWRQLGLWLWSLQGGRNGDIISVVIDLKVEVKPREGMRKGQSYSLDTITYGSTVKEAKEKRRPRRIIQARPLENQEEKSFKKEVIKCVKHAQSQVREGLECARFRNMVVTSDLSESSFNGE